MFGRKPLTKSLVVNFPKKNFLGKNDHEVYE